MKIFAVRHLPTEWNKKGLLQGSRDIPILSPSKEDLNKIKHNKKLFIDLDFKAISSPLERATQTTGLYIKTYEIEPLIKEIDFKQYEGKGKKELLKDTKNEWINNPAQSILKNEVKELETRIKAFLEKYKNQEYLFLVSHGAFIRGLKAIVELKDINQMNSFVIGNNELVEISYE